MRRYKPIARVRKIPADYHTKPDYVLLDFAQALQQYAWDTAEVQEFEYPVDDILAESLLYLSPSWIAPENFECLVLDLLEKYPIDGPLLATAVRNLGKSLQCQLVVCKAYTCDGNLYYEVEPREHWFDSSTPVLVRQTLVVQAS